MPRAFSQLSCAETERPTFTIGVLGGVGSANGRWGCSLDLDTDEAIADAGIEVPAFGFRLQEFLIGPGRNAEVTIDRPSAEFQLQNGQGLLITSGLEQGGVQIDPLHGYLLRLG
jgi:hypothetical protein